MYAFIKAMRAVFDATPVRVILILFVGIPGLGFLAWTLLIEGTGFMAFFSTATADERSVLRLAAFTFWALVVGWLGMFLRLLCSSSYLDTLPLLRSFVLLLLGAFTIFWVALLFRSSGSFLLTVIPSLLTLLLILGTLPVQRQHST